jgi:hypothetical protein
MKVAFVSVNPTLYDPMTNKIIRSLKKTSESYRIICIGVNRRTKYQTSQSIDDTLHYSLNLYLMKLSKNLNLIRLPLLYIEYFLKLMNKLNRYKPDLIYAYNFSTLIPATVYKFLNNKTVFIYHALELESQQGSSRFFNLLIFSVEKWCSKKIDHIFTPSISSAFWYKDKLKTNKVSTLFNSPDVAELIYLEDFYFSNRFGFPNDETIFIHSGNLTRNRNIDLMVKVFSENNIGRLIFIGEITSDEYSYLALNEIKNVYYHEPVKHKHLVSYIKKADVGLILINPSNLSYKMSLANKFLEYVNSNIPIIFGNLEEYINLNTKYNLGIGIVPSYNELLKAAISISTRLDKFYNEVPLELTWEYQQNKILDLSKIKNTKFQ